MKQTFNGRAILLLAAIVLNIPGNNVVRTTWNSNAFGLDKVTAELALGEFLSLRLMSFWEHKAKVSASLKLDWASSFRS